MRYVLRFGGEHLIRARQQSLGTEVDAFAAARKQGWDGKTPMTYFDSDGYPLGGFVPA